MSLLWRRARGLPDMPPPPAQVPVKAILVRWSDVDPDVCFLSCGQRDGVQPGEQYVWAVRVSLELPRPALFPSLVMASDIWMCVDLVDVERRWSRARVTYRAPAIFRNVGFAGEETKVLSERGLEWSPWFPAPAGYAGRMRYLRPIVGTVLTRQGTS